MFARISENFWIKCIGKFVALLSFSAKEKENFTSAIKVSNVKKGITFDNLHYDQIEEDEF